MRMSTASLGLCLGVLYHSSGCSTDIAVTDRVGVAPTVAITAPEDASTFLNIDAIEFLGTVSDADGLGDVKSVVWMSDIDMELGSVEPDSQGQVRLATTLSSGLHTITLSATDASGKASEDAITVIVEGDDQVPSVEINSPLSLSQFDIGDPISVVGGLSDGQQPPESLLVLWSWEPSTGGTPVEIPGGAPTESGVTVTTWSDAPAGDHRIVLSVTDDDGNSASADVVITVIDTNALDNDQDGAPAGTDCDDNDPNTYPGAEELCDNVDNDCDTIIDNRDIDLDGHIDALCLDFVGVADDCDDNNSNVYPGAPEFEDGQDNNCDGDIDEGSDAFDDDGDCYCEGNGPCLWSSNPACVVLDIGDCDDSDAALNLDDLDGDGYDTCAGDCRPLSTTAKTTTTIYD